MTNTKKRPPNRSAAGEADYIRDETVRLKAKGKSKTYPNDALTIALREYERTSYYLATKKDFDFTIDHEAQELYHTFEQANAPKISNLTTLRLESAGLKSIPKGLHVPGLALRTNERMRRNALAKKKGKK